MEFQEVHGVDDEQNEGESSIAEQLEFRLRVEGDVENLKCLLEGIAYQCHYLEDQLGVFLKWN
jgi:hypothetical protein